VAQDVRLGLVSPEAAERDYAVAVDRTGVVNEKATAKLRAKTG
jgi:N-methylhydantoinase B